MFRSRLTWRNNQMQRRRLPVRKGAAMVEMALVLPVFLLLLLGIFEFGRALSISQMVTNASREGCRRAVLDGSTNTEIETYVEDFLSGSIGINTSDVTVEFYVNDVLANVSTAVETDKIKVRVEIEFDTVSLTGADYLKGKQLVGETTMRHE